MEYGSCCRYRVSGKFDANGDIKVIDRFHESDAADLKQIVHILVMIVKPLDHGENKAQISFNISLSCGFIAGMNPLKQCLLFFVL